MIRRLLPVMLVVALFALAACDGRQQAQAPAPHKDATQASASAPQPPAASPVVASKRSPVTDEFFRAVVSKSLGDKWGKAEMRDEGLLLHPGDKQPTILKVDGAGKAQLAGRGFIAELDEAGKSVPDAGTVGFEIRLDGKSVKRFSVDRRTPADFVVPLNGAKEIEVVVDNGNGKSAWDWFILDVRAFK